MPRRRRLVAGSGAGYGGVGYTGVLSVAGSFMPNINPASNGILQIYGTAASGAMATSLEAAAPGNGYMWIGGNGASLTISSMAPGAGNTYRFSNAMLGGQLTVNNGSSGPALTGNNNVIVYQGSLRLTGPQTFTGNITVLDAASDQYNQYNWSGPPGLCGNAQTTAGASPFGSATGNVSLIGGTIGLYGVANGQAVNEGNLGFQGGDIIYLASGGHTNQLIFSSGTQTHNGTLVVWDSSNDLGTNNNLVFTSGLAAGLVPCMVSANGYNTGNFVSNPGNGTTLTDIPFVAMPSGAGTGTEVVQTSGVNLGGATVTISALRANGAVTNGTVVLTSGALILTGTSQRTPPTSLPAAAARPRCTSSATATPSTVTAARGPRRTR